MSGGWIGVDLDGTLAHYDVWKGIDHVGEPVPMMMGRVRAWLAEDRAVKIFTARVSVPEPDKSEVVAVIHKWLVAHGLPPLEVTNVKDFGMMSLYDDRAVQIRMNTGEIVG